MINYKPFGTGSKDSPSLYGGTIPLLPLSCNQVHCAVRADMENIVRAHDWLQYSRIIDLHGNSGKFLATVLSAKGHLGQKGILVQPQVLAQEGGEEAAAKIAESHGVSEQMSFAAGDLHRAGLAGF